MQIDVDRGQENPDGVRLLQEGVGATVQGCIANPGLSLAWAEVNGRTMNPMAVQIRKASQVQSANERWGRVTTALFVATPTGCRNPP